MEEAKNILRDIKKKALKPMYFLMGEEAYFIDAITDYIANNVLTEAERGFNQMVIYGKDTSIDDIVANAKRYPMMAEHQVVIIKEAQHLSRTIEQLASYAENPQPTTILVVCYKFKKIDKRKSLYKAILKSDGVVFESKKLYENQVIDWVTKFAKGKGFTIDPKASVMLVEFLGTDLGKISNEIDKLFLSQKETKYITPESVEENIGISKDYNNFELKKAIGERDITKVGRIIAYFSQNPKDNPFVVTIGTLQSFFTQLLQYHGLKDKSQRNVASVLRVNPYFVKEYEIAARNYPMKVVSKIIAQLRELDLKSKGVGAQNMHQKELLKELLFKTV
ncbi:DNA polymerase III subunit delta [Croceivirga lutea]|uniref:DNA polymerase III subunit delta n=1 Tax=Croceivirga lutea TaxID=1775167 RepID=UPI00163B321E|nr:DNA polymerase III subunit delta [Croceivirga lutea]GGG45979.1 DNA polymerase III subunit delta [Croceivirga lutea]